MNTKYNIFLSILLSFLISLSSACSKDDDTSNLTYFQTGGCIAINFSYQDESFEYKLDVINKNMGASTTQITLFTQEELTEYNRNNSTNYQFMPQGTYELGETNITFNEDNIKETCIKIHPDKLFDIIRKDTETKQYTIPLKLSEQSISNNNSIAIYVMNIDYPKLCLDERKNIRLIKKETEVILEACTYKEDKIIPNQGNIELSLIVPDNAEEWLRMYNDTSTIKYQLLPKDAYELGKVFGKEGEKCSTSVKFKRTFASGSSLEYGHFILPVKLAGIDEYVALNHNISVITINNPNSYDDISREYDDGENIIFHVKLAIDKEGLEMMHNDMEYFRNNLAIQWDEINKRFNGLDKKGMLKRNYIFVPDLEDIIVFKYVDGNSNWNVANDYKDQIDINKFQLVVSYDFWQQSDEGGGGFGGVTPEGLDHIKVTCYSKSKEDIDNIFNLNSSLHDEAITHELGHFRGIMDTYWCEFNKNNNLITHEGFSPEKGNMMGACYEPTKTAYWSDYEMYVINATGCKNTNIYKTVNQYFADDIEITVTENGKPVKGFTLNYYKEIDLKDDPNKGKMVPESIYNTYKSTTNKVVMSTTNKLFYWDSWTFENRPATWVSLVLFEAISNETGNKGYIFIPIYEAHKQGLIDKFENKITGRSILRKTIDIK